MNRRKQLLMAAAVVLFGLPTIGCYSETSSSNYSRTTPTPSPSLNTGATPMSRNDNAANNTSGDNAIKPGGFNNNLPAGFNAPSDDVGKRLLKEYGSVFMRSEEH